MTTPITANEQKRATIETFLAGGHTVELYLDARRQFVGVPHALRGEPGLRLDIGYNTPTPCTGLELDDVGVAVTLSFNRRTAACFVPWEAIWGASCPYGKVIWPRSVPPEVANAAMATPAAAPPAGVISLDSHRSARDMAHVAARRAAKLTAPDAPAPDGAA